MKEQDAYDIYLQSEIRYNEECGDCITRQMTDEEKSKYGVKINDKEKEIIQR